MLTDMASIGETLDVVAVEAIDSSVYGSGGEEFRVGGAIAFSSKSLIIWAIE